MLHALEPSKAALLNRPHLYKLDDDMLELVIAMDLDDVPGGWSGRFRQQRVIQLASISRYIRHVIIKRGSFWGSIWCTPATRVELVALALRRSGRARLSITLDDSGAQIGTLSPQWYSNVRTVLHHINRAGTFRVAVVPHGREHGSIMRSMPAQVAQWTPAPYLCKLEITGLSESDLLMIIGPALEELNLAEMTISAPAFQQALMAAPRLRVLNMIFLRLTEVTRVQPPVNTVGLRIANMTIKLGQQQTTSKFIHTTLSTAVSTAREVFLDCNNHVDDATLVSQLLTGKMPSGDATLDVAGDDIVFAMAFDDGRRRVFTGLVMPPRSTWLLFSQATVINVRCDVSKRGFEFFATFCMLAECSLPSVRTMTVDVHMAQVGLLGNPASGLAIHLMTLPALEKLTIRLHREPSPDGQFRPIFSPAPRNIGRFCVALVDVIRVSHKVELRLGMHRVPKVLVAANEAAEGRYEFQAAD